MLKTALKEINEVEDPKSLISILTHLPSELSYEEREAIVCRAWSKLSVLIIF